MKALFSLVLLVLGACTSSSEPPLPSEPDPPLFAPPTGGCGLPEYELVDDPALGEIVAWELAPEATLPAAGIDVLLAAGGVTEFSPVAYGVRTYRVRYRTQDKGALVEASALISFPTLDGAWPVSAPTVLWGHPTVGFRDQCAPSALGVEGAAANLLLSSMGYAVAAPDYLGMVGFGEPSGELHPWIVPEPTALATLDGLRALFRFSDARLDPLNNVVADRRVVGWGASEGAFATLWADRYADYLPQAQIIGVVAAVPPSDLVGMAIDATNPQLAGGGLIDASAGLVGVMTANHVWNEGPEPLHALFATEIADALPDALQCDDGDLLDDVTELEQAFTPLVLDNAPDAWGEPWSCYLTRGSLGRTNIPRTGDAPVLFIIAGADELTVARAQREDVPRLCAQGYQLDVIECADAGHVDGAALSLPQQIAWVKARFDGDSLASDLCVLRPPVDCSAR